MIVFPGIARLWAVLPEARIVGGAVRDHLVGAPIADVDFAVPQPPEAVVRTLRAAGIRCVPTGLAHGTVTAVIEGRGFEITSLRRDVETDGRHAVVAFIDDWQTDAARRDFTINAMSMARDGSVFDYFNGRQDLAAGVIRFVGDPATRIAEDHLRILRFFRFYARYGSAPPDAAAIAAITQARAGVTRLSAERVWSEIKRILLAPDPRAALALMQATGVLPLIVPEGTELGALARLVAAGAPADPLLRVAALLRGDADAFARRLKLSHAEALQIEALRRPFTLTPEADDPALLQALADEDAAMLAARSWLAQKMPDVRWQALRERLARLKRPEFPLHGPDLLALGLSPGPRLGAILREVRRWWRDRGCADDAAACLEQARRLL